MVSYLSFHVSFLWNCCHFATTGVPQFAFLLLNSQIDEGSVGMQNPPASDLHWEDALLSILPADICWLVLCTWRSSCQKPLQRGLPMGLKAPAAQAQSARWTLTQGQYLVSNMDGEPQPLFRLLQPLSKCICSAAEDVNVLFLFIMLFFFNVLYLNSRICINFSKQPSSDISSSHEISDGFKLMRPFRYNCWCGVFFFFKLIKPN